MNLRKTAKFCILRGFGLNHLILNKLDMYLINLEKNIKYGKLELKTVAKEKEEFGFNLEMTSQMLHGL